MFFPLSTVIFPPLLPSSPPPLLPSRGTSSIQQVSNGLERHKGTACRIRFLPCSHSTRSPLGAKWNETHTFKSLRASVHAGSTDGALGGKRFGCNRGAIGGGGRLLKRALASRRLRPGRTMSVTHRKSFNVCVWGGNRFLLLCSYSHTFKSLLPISPHTTGSP